MDVNVSLAFDDLCKLGLAETIFSCCLETFLKTYLRAVLTEKR